MDLEALKRELSDALAAYEQDDLVRLDGLVEAIRSGRRTDCTPRSCEAR